MGPFPIARAAKRERFNQPYRLPPENAGWARRDHPASIGQANDGGQAVAEAKLDRSAKRAPLRSPDLFSGAVAPSGPASTRHRAPARARIAMFTNAYPSISHSFIRNEISALERQGIDVVRITVRGSSAAAIDPADQAEAQITHRLLGGPRGQLASAVLARMRKAPARFLSALRLTLSEPQRAAGPLRNIAYLVEACRLAEIAEARGASHIHAHFGTNPAAIARLAARLSDLSFSMTVHGPDEFDAPALLHIGAKIADASFVVAISDFGRSQLMRWSKVADWPKIAVVRCGVAPAFCEQTSAGKAAHAAPLFVCVARLSAQKGLPVLLEAAAILARDESFELRIVGDGDLRPQLEAGIAQHDLERCVRLLGWLPADGVRREISGARALVLPSFAEGLPIVLMEALALGRPVIATAIAGMPELIDAQTGWVVRAGSADALAQAMRQALHADPGQLAAMGAVGRQRVQRDHDIDRNAARLADLLRAAVQA